VVRGVFLTFWIGLLVHEGAHQVLFAILSRSGTLSQALAYLPAAAGPLTTLTIVVVTTVLSVRARNETAQRMMFVTALTAASRSGSHGGSDDAGQGQ
jgi:hypothetical protein